MLAQAKGLLTRRRTRRLIAVVTLAMLLVFLVKSITLIGSAFTIVRHALHLTQIASNPELVLQPTELEHLGGDLAAIETSLRTIRAELRADLFPTWIPVPALRRNLAAVDVLIGVAVDLLVVARSGTNALQPIVAAVSPAQFRGQGASNANMSELLFGGLAQARPHLVHAASQMRQTTGDLARWGGAGLAWPLSRGVPYLQKYLNLGAIALDAAAAVPELLGDTSPANYLIMAQNSDEIRATGGFITGIGVASLQHGKLDSLVIRDSYDFDKFTVDHPWAPEPMQRYMGIFLWVTRDGNWWPDFPTSAQAVQDLYHLENAGDIDAVIAFDLYALEDLVTAVGPLYLEELREQITGKDVLQKTRDFWNPPVPEGMTMQEWLDSLGWTGVKEEWWSGRKDFMGLLAKALLSKVQSSRDPRQLLSLGKAMIRLLQEKHLQLYFHNPQVQALLATTGLDGTVNGDWQGDYLLALDTNMGYNKVNLNVEKLVHYEVDLSQPLAPLATLAITYHNHSPAEPACIQAARVEASYALMAEGCYWNYLRVYAPLGSRLLASEGVTETQTLPAEQGKTVFSTFLLVPAAESRTVRLHYLLPARDVSDYSLLVQKQPGTDAVPLNVRVLLSAKALPANTVPEPSVSSTGLIAFDSNLEQDRVFRVELR